MELIINNKQEMIAFATYIGQSLKKHDTLLLNGDLGAGKTFFTQYIAKSLGISEEVTSPTFTIVKEYVVGSVNLYHIDAYRLEGINEDLSYINDFYQSGITIIEWPEFIVDYLPTAYVQFYITNLGAQKRKLEISFVNNEELERVIRQYG